ncbi:MAG TPA: lipid-A-disaccharide synthase N-terminal domain-containing protein [Bacteroidota bacterium]|nr:lipid-A-disaccharide synthase N-terminal domain-containing protein [Bacteroidota bacterium]
MEWIGLIGVIAFALAWIPQSLETIRAGRCDVNLAFLLLAAVGSLSLMLYAFLKGDIVFSAVNLLTTLGALINVVYKLFPRSDNSPGTS